MKRAVIAALASIALALGWATPAHAAVPSCASGYICYFNYPDGSGRLLDKLMTSYTRSVCYSWPSTINNKVSYVRNNSAYDLVVYDAYDCSGTVSVLYAHTSGSMNLQWDNAMSSSFRP